VKGGVIFLHFYECLLFFIALYDAGGWHLVALAMAWRLPPWQAGLAWPLGTTDGAFFSRITIECRSATSLKR
jgi:hypothetical protein